MSDIAATRYAGARINRVEDGRLLTGRGTFVDDVSRPGMLHACFVRSPFARARIEAIDTSEALALPGVQRGVRRRRPQPRCARAVVHADGPEDAGHARPPLAEDEVRFVGDPVALVVAESRYLAEDAAELVVVDYEPLPALVDYITAASSDELVHENAPGQRRRPARRRAAGDHRRGRRDGRTRRQRDDLPAGATQPCRSRRGG